MRREFFILANVNETQHSSATLSGMNGHQKGKWRKQMIWLNLEVVSKSGAFGSRLAEKIHQLAPFFNQMGSRNFRAPVAFPPFCYLIISLCATSSALPRIISLHLLIHTCHLRHLLNKHLHPLFALLLHGFQQRWQLIRPNQPDILVADAFPANSAHTGLPTGHYM